MQNFSISYPRLLSHGNEAAIAGPSASHGTRFRFYQLTRSSAILWFNIGTTEKGDFDHLAAQRGGASSGTTSDSTSRLLSVTYSWVAR